MLKRLRLVSRDALGRSFSELLLLLVHRLYCHLGSSCWLPGRHSYGVKKRRRLGVLFTPQMTVDSGVSDFSLANQERERTWLGAAGLMEVHAFTQSSLTPL